jgi:hypothetical protein
MERHARHRFEHVRAIGRQGIGLAVGVERPAHVAEVALVDGADVAPQLGALALVDMGVAPRQQIDQRRPLAGGAVEELERLVGAGVGRRQRQHPLVAVGGAVGLVERLPRRGQLAEPERRGAVAGVDEAAHRVERQLGEAAGGPGLAQQRLEVGRRRRLLEGAEARRQRAVEVAELALQDLGERAQDLGALGPLLDGTGAVEIVLDPLLPVGGRLGRELGRLWGTRGRRLGRGRRRAGGHAARGLGDGGAEARWVDLGERGGELLGERLDHGGGEDTAGRQHGWTAKQGKCQDAAPPGSRGDHRRRRAGVPDPPGT